MWEPEVLPRELQNHLRHWGTLQRTTQAGLWMPQYLSVHSQWRTRGTRGLSRLRHEQAASMMWFKRHTAMS